MSFESLARRFPLFSLKEFLIESKEFTTENLLSFSQNWEMHKQKLKDLPLHLAFYKFVLEIRESLPYEENNAYHTLLGHILYLTGNLTDLSRMIVPSEPLLVLYQSLANFYLGKFQRAKELAKTVLVITDYSNINLSCFIYSMKLFIDSFYFIDSNLSETKNTLRNLIEKFKNNPTELAKSQIIFAEAMLLPFEDPSEEKIIYIDSNINNLDYWSSGMCLTQLAKHYLKVQDSEKALITVKKAIDAFGNLPDTPDKFHPYFLLFDKFKEELSHYESSINKYFPLKLMYLVNKKRLNLINQKESEELNSFIESKSSYPKYFHDYLS